MIKQLFTHPYTKPVIGALMFHVFIISLIIYSVYFYHVKKPSPIIMHVATTPSVVIKTDEFNKHAPLSHLVETHFGKFIKIEKSFNAGPNLTGFIVSIKTNPDEKSILYADKKGRFFFIGTLFNAKGVNKTLVASTKYLEDPLKKTIYENTQKLSGIVQGNPHAKHLITIIIDPNSSIFPLQYTNLAYDVATDDVGIKWVLLNYLKPDGPNTAGYILQATNPQQALAYNAQHYNKITQTGGYQRHEPIKSTTLSTLRAHWDFVQRFNLYALPMTIFATPNHYYVIKGFFMDELLENYVNSILNK